MATFPIDWVRAQFPSLRLSIAGQRAIFLDGPGGTQVPEIVIRAVSDHYRKFNSNLGGQFLTSRKTVEAVRQARITLAEFVNAPQPEEIIFGLNMTSLTFALSRALVRTWDPGAEVVVTSLDHDANVTPWRLATGDSAVTVKIWEVREQGCRLEVEDLQKIVNERTKLIAVTLASNAAGTHVDVQAVCNLAHRCLMGPISVTGDARQLPSSTCFEPSPREVGDWHAEF